MTYLWKKYYKTSMRHLYHFPINTDCIFLYLQWRQTYGCSVCTCTYSFPAPPRNYTYKCTSFSALPRLTNDHPGHILHIWEYVFFNENHTKLVINNFFLWWYKPMCSQIFLLSFFLFYTFFLKIFTTPPMNVFTDL